MRVEDIINQMNGSMNQQSVLLRKPTVEELDKFIDKVVVDYDETLYTMAQAIMFKLERSVHSLPEAEIYPMVIQRIQERLNKGES